MAWEIRTSADTWFLALDEIHVKPVEDLIAHGWSGCICGPSEEQHGLVTIYQHCALDGRELVEIGET